MADTEELTLRGRGAGSYARQEADAASDIDLIVMGGKDFDLTDVLCIGEELHRVLGKSVDVYELREIDSSGQLVRMKTAVRIRLAAPANPVVPQGTACFCLFWTLRLQTKRIEQRSEVGRRHGADLSLQSRCG